MTATVNALFNLFRWGGIAKNEIGEQPHHKVAPLTSLCSSEHNIYHSLNPNQIQLEFLPSQ